MKINLAKNLKRLRRERGITQGQLADAMAVTPQSVSRWENGQSFPDVAQLPILAQYFNVTLDELMGNDVSPQSKLLSELSEAEKKAHNNNSYADKIRAADILEKLANMDPVKYCTRYFAALSHLYEPARIESARQLCRKALDSLPAEKRSSILLPILSMEDEEHRALWRDYVTNVPDMATWDDMMLTVYRVKYSDKWEEQRQCNIYTSICKILYLHANDVPSLKDRTHRDGITYLPLNPTNSITSAIELLNVYSTRPDDIFLPTRIYVEYHYALSLFAEGKTEEGFDTLAEVKDHLRLLAEMSHGVTCCGSVPALQLVTEQMNFAALANAIFDITSNEPRYEFDAVREDERFIKFFRFASMFGFDGPKMSFIESPDKLEARIEMKEYIPMLELAHDMIESNPKNHYSEVVVLLDEFGVLHSYYDPDVCSENDHTAEEEFIAKLQNIGSPRITKILVLWSNGSVDLPSYRLREKLYELDQNNGTAEILLNGRDYFVSRPMITTLSSRTLNEKKEKAVITQSEFKHALDRGLGRCVDAVRENPKKYQHLVHWACCNNPVFDTQCEGSRAYYVSTLISLYEDKNYFLGTIADSLLKADYGWDICYFGELLLYFKDELYGEPLLAVWHKYEALYAELDSFDSAPDGVFDAYDNFNLYIEYLIDDYDDYRQIALDVGKLFLKHQYLRECGFSGMFRDDHKAAFENEPEQSREAKAFLAYNEPQRPLPRKDKKVDISELSGIPLSLRLQREPIEVIESYADKYLAAETTEERTAALKAFSLCPYPASYSPTPIIKDAESGIPSLSFVATQALHKIRHPEVREYAERLMKTDPDAGFSFIVKNYQKGDGEYISKFLSRLSIDRENESGWHGHHMSVLDMYEDPGENETPPLFFLTMIYETTLCSCCRLRAVGYMDKYGVLTKETLNECLCDSNADIRAIAKEKLEQE